jgi:uncharacterized Zn finger protein
MSRKPNEKITTLEFAKLSSFLTEKGLQANHLTTAIGETRRNRTRQQVVNDLVIWLRSLPKGSIKTVSKGEGNQ